MTKAKPNFAAGKLKSFVERIERVEIEIGSLNADKSEIYKEARGEGFDPAIIRLVVRERGKDELKRVEQGELFDLYWGAIHNENSTVGKPIATRVHVREDAPVKSVTLDDIPIASAHLVPPPADDELPDIPPQFDRRPKVAA